MQHALRSGHREADIENRTIVIVGRDAAAWLAAAAFAAALREQPVTVAVVELPSALTATDAYVSQPPLEGLHRLIGIDEWAMLRAARGSFTLGHDYRHFGGARSDIFQPHGGHGVDFAGTPFLAHWLRAVRHGLTAEFEDFSLNARAARALKFFKPGPQSAALHACDYGYQLDAQGYVAHIKAHVVASGLSVTPASELSYTHAADGTIASVTIDGGHTIAADIFVDATGAASYLLGVGMGSAPHSLAERFPFRRTLSLSLEPIAAAPPYTQSRASSHGVAHLAALRDRIAATFAFDPDVTLAETAYQALGTLGRPMPDTAAAVNDLALGFRQPWVGNVVGIGGAAAVLDPIGRSELQLIHLGIAHFLAAFPQAGGFAAQRQQFNDVMIGACADLADFQQTHYRLNRILDRRVWEAQTRLPVPPALERRLDAFRRDGSVPASGESGLHRHDWEAVLIGHGIVPRAYDPAADRFDERAAKTAFAELLREIASSVESMGTLETYLEDL